jgi:hypothetical protein
MNPQEYEQQIQQQRTEEAEKKGFLGQDGKIAIVLRNLGQPIMLDAPGGGLVDTNYLDDPYDVESIEESTTAEELRDRMPMQQILNADGTDPSPGGEPDWRENPDTEFHNPVAIGYHFDGLSRGMHLEIKYEEDTNIFSVHYKGHEVYREVKGNLMAYFPVPEWEEWIERLFKIAKPIELQKRSDFAQQEAQEIMEEKTSWLESLKKRWGM